VVSDTQQSEVIPTDIPLEGASHGQVLAARI
jgi:hypothetical protein